MPIQTFRLDQLEVSPLNVRTNAEDANAVDALAASIRAKGLLYPLVVHPIDGGRFGVLAGGRRLRALHQLAMAGDHAADAPVECIVRDLPEAEITELSLSENLLRRELHPYEVHAAIARAADQGHSADEIAVQLGQRPAWVRQQLRLGRLSPVVFSAYVAGELSVEVARAYASTEDQALQIAAFQHFARTSRYDHTPQAVRAFLKVGDRELARQLAFVGDDAYRAAGGRFELDLFADGPEERGRVVDEALLLDLFDRKLETIREKTRLHFDWPDLRFQAGPPTFDGRTDWPLAIEPADLPRDATRGTIVATIDLANDGEPEVRFWWASRKAKGDAGKPLPKCEPKGLAPSGAEAIGRDDYNYGQRARADLKDEHGLTADGLQVIRSLRRELLRAVLLFDANKGGNLGRDYLVWAQLRQELLQHRSPETGARGLASLWDGRDSEPHDIVSGQLQDSIAGSYWRDHLDEIGHAPWMVAADPSISLGLFVGLGEDVKSRAAAVLAGLALLRSVNAPGWRIAAHDALATLAGADDAQLRRFWRPTAAFAGLFPKLKRLALAQPHVAAGEFKGWSKLADKVLAGAVAGALEQAKSWMHPLLTFAVTPGRAAPDVVYSQVEEVEPAE